MPLWGVSAGQRLYLHRDGEMASEKTKIDTWLLTNVNCQGLGIGVWEDVVLWICLMFVDRSK